MSENEVVKEAYKVKDLKSATWCMDKIAEYKKEIEEKSKIAKEEIALLEAKIKQNKDWIKKETEEFESSKTFFESLLIEYYKGEKAVNKKFKLSTPYGSLTARKTKKWYYDNEEEIKEYFKENDPELVKIKTEIDKNELKKRYPEGINLNTGEIIPSIRIEEEENFTIKINSL